MSQVLPQPVASPLALDAIAGRPTTTSRGVLAWCLGATLLLVGSGVVRAVQSNRYNEDRTASIDCPFPLKTLPRTIGGWHVLNGSETVLDPLTTRITGSTDHILLTYMDDMTGVALSVLVLYGPAEPVLPHTPEVCYPSSGFQPAGETIDRSIKISDQEQATFRSSLFAKPGGRNVIRKLVYHSFLLNTPWTPSIANRKFPRKNPGIYKVQIERRVVDGERRDGDEPIEDFVQKLVPVIEKMNADALRGQSTAVAANTK